MNLFRQLEHLYLQVSIPLFFQVKKSSKNHTNDSHKVSLEEREKKGY